jgi:hypothetical protein
MAGMPPRRTCVLCGIDEARDKHHLIPRTVHRNKWFKKRYTRTQMSRTIPVCRGCHKMINSLDQKEVGRNFNTVEALKEHPKLAKYIAWKRRRLKRKRRK